MNGETVKVLTPVYNFLRNICNNNPAVYRILQDDTRVINYKEMLQLVGSTAYYILPAILFVVAALMLYRARKLESAGDMVAFNWGRPVFRVVFVFCTSLLFALAVYELCFGTTISSYAYGRIFRIILVLVGVGTVLFYLLSNMILDRTFFIWRKTSYWRMALFAVLMMLGLVGVRDGQIGTKIPARNNITEVDVRIQFGDEDYFYQKAFLSLKDAKGIDEIYKQNKAILKYGRNLDNNSDDETRDTIEITYHFKGGKRKCIYPVESGEAVVNKLEKYLENRDDMCEMIYGEKYKEHIQRKMYVEERYTDPIEIDEEGNEEEPWGSGVLHCWSWDKSNKKQQEIRDALYEAVCKDIEAGRCDTLHMKSVNCFYVGVVNQDNDTEQVVQITEKCSETLKVLEKLGHVNYYEGQWEMSSGVVGGEGIDK